MRRSTAFLCATVSEDLLRAERFRAPPRLSCCSAAAASCASCSASCGASQLACSLFQVFIEQVHESGSSSALMSGGRRRHFPQLSCSHCTHSTAGAAAGSTSSSSSLSSSETASALIDRRRRLRPSAEDGDTSASAFAASASSPSAAAAPGEAEAVSSGTSSSLPLVDKMEDQPRSLRTRTSEPPDVVTVQDSSTAIVWPGCSVPILLEERSALWRSAAFFTQR